MDCFDLTDRVPGTCICSQCYVHRMTIDRHFMNKRPKVERHRAIGMERTRQRDRELRLADRLEREWTPPLAEILKEAG
jgi:hypothetical protein